MEFATRMWVVLLAFLLPSCASTYSAQPSANPVTDPTEQVIYLLGDFGVPTDVLDDVTNAMSRDLAAGRTAEFPPLMIELGDNLYETGLPTRLEDDRGAVQRLGEMARLIARCRRDGEPVPLILVPGNHDHSNEALSYPRRKGAISRWYYPEELGIPELESWLLLPGQRPAGVLNSALLAAAIYESPASLAEFLAPRPVPGTSPAIGIVAIDSQLLIDLYRCGHDDIAERYLEELRIELRRFPATAWRAVAAHHPLETYSKHRPLQAARLLFGPGWPQFPNWLHKVSAVPPLGTLATLVWWGVHNPQDVHNSSYTRYRRELLELLKEERVSMLLAGHDHCTQLIELQNDPDGATVLQVHTGEAAKIDPVTAGKGTLAYHSGGGFVRLVVHERVVEVEMCDRDGVLVHRHLLHR